MVEIDRQQTILNEIERNIKELKQFKPITEVSEDPKEIKENYEKMKKIFVPFQEFIKFKDKSLEDIDNEIKIENNEYIKKLIDPETNLLITGKKGTGKTTYFSMSFFNLIEKKSPYIPIFIDLKNLFSFGTQDFHENETKYIQLVNNQTFFISLYAAIQLSLIKYLNIYSAFYAESQEIIAAKEFLSKDLEKYSKFVIDASVEIEESIKDKNQYTEKLNILKAKYKRNIIDYLEKNEKLPIDIGLYEIIQLLRKINSILKKKGFIIYLDEFSEYCIQNVSYKDNLGTFIQKITQDSQNQQKDFRITFKISVYHKSDFSKFIKIENAPDKKYFQQEEALTLDLFDFLKIGDNETRDKGFFDDNLRIFCKLLLYKTFNIRLNSNKISLSDVFQDESFSNEKNFYKLITNSTTAAPREIGNLISYAIDRMKKDNKTKIDYVALNHALKTLYRNHVDVPEQELRDIQKSLEDIVLSNYQKGEKNSIYVLHEINDDLFQNSIFNREKLENYIQKFNQNYLLLPISKIKGEKLDLINIYFYHPGYICEQVFKESKNLDSLIKQLNGLIFSGQDARIASMKWFASKNYISYWELKKDSYECKNEPSHKRFQVLTNRKIICLDCAEIESSNPLRVELKIKKPRIIDKTQVIDETMSETLGKFIESQNLIKSEYKKIIQHLYKKEDKIADYYEIKSELELDYYNANYCLTMLKRKKIIESIPDSIRRYKLKIIFDNTNKWKFE